MKIVLDTNILISATLWDKSVAQKILFELIRKEIEIYTSKEILEEYEKVLERDFNYSKEEIAEILTKILKILIIIKPTRKVSIVEDPQDNKIIECALESKSTHIITYDKHLLKIVEYEGIKIQKPEEFRKII